MLDLLSGLHAQVLAALHSPTKLAALWLSFTFIFNVLLRGKSTASLVSWIGSVQFGRFKIGALFVDACGHLGVDLPGLIDKLRSYMAQDPPPPWGGSSGGGASGAGVLSAPSLHKLARQLPRALAVPAFAVLVAGCAGFWSDAKTVLDDGQKACIIANAALPDATIAIICKIEGAVDNVYDAIDTTASASRAALKARAESSAAECAK